MNKKYLIGGTIFILLNMIDMWLTLFLVKHGGTEANWYAIMLGHSVLFVFVKTILPLLVVCLLVWYGRAKLFKWLNAGMGIVVLINSIGLFSYLIGR